MRVARLTIALLLSSLPASAASLPSFKATNCYQSRKSVDINARSDGREHSFEFREEGIHLAGPTVKVGGGQRFQPHWLFQWSDEVDSLGYRPTENEANFGALTITLLPSPKSRSPDKVDIYEISHVADRCWSDIKGFVTDHRIGVRLLEAAQ